MSAKFKNKIKYIFWGLICFHTQLSLGEVIAQTTTTASQAVVSSSLVDARAALAHFIQTTHHCQMMFTQTVIPPSKGGGVSAKKKNRVSQGQFAFIRPSGKHPGRFRFDYEKPAQTWVADGRTLWWYDPDLRQATQQPQAQALSGTPVALIATATSVGTLEKDFEIKAAEKTAAGSLPTQTPQASTWTLDAIAKPSPANNHGTVDRLRLELTLYPSQQTQTSPVTQLTGIQLTDRLGQVSDLRFSQIDCRNPIPETRFVFTPPVGVEVIQTTATTR